MLTVGLTQFIFAVLLLYTDEYKKRCVSVYILLLCLLFDSLIVHEPFSEELREQEREMMQFGGNLLMGACLLMLVGVRHTG